MRSTPASDGAQPRGIPTGGRPTEDRPTVPEVDTSEEHLAAIVTNEEILALPAEVSGFGAKATSW